MFVFQHSREANMTKKMMQENETPEDLPIINRAPIVRIQRPGQDEHESQDQGQQPLHGPAPVITGSGDFSDNDSSVRTTMFTGTACGASFGIDDLHNAAHAIVRQLQDPVPARFRATPATRTIAGAENNFGIFHLRQNFSSIHVDDRHRKIF